MPGLLSSGPNAALVAYGTVIGADGTVVIDGENTTAGQVVVTRTSLGHYSLTLPTGHGQSRSRSMVYCAVISTLPRLIAVEDAASQVKTVRTFNFLGADADVDFSFMIFENTEPKTIP